MTKRTFFKSLMGAVAAVALAPEIAFGVRLKMPEALPEKRLESVMWWIWNPKEQRHHWATTEEMIEAGVNPNNWKRKHSRLTKDGTLWIGELQWLDGQ